MSQQPTLPLPQPQRTLLNYALDLVASQMASHSDEFDDEDRDALTALRKLIEE